MYFVIPSIIFVLQSVPSTGQWMLLTNPKMPRPDYAMAIGIHNGSFYMMGSESLMEYNIAQNAFIDHGERFFKDSIYGDSTFYTQVGDVLYILSDPGVLNAFNLDTKELTESVFTLPIPVHYSACLNSNSDYLSATGGWNSKKAIATVQILDLTTLQWLDNVPSLTQNRFQHACAIDLDILYAIGGHVDVNPLSMIESISTLNIAQNTWQKLGDLPVAVGFARAVVHEHVIYVLGGGIVDGPGYTLYNTVQMINAITHEVSVSPHDLVSSLSEVAPIIMNNVIYAFGGWEDAGPTDTWMTYQLPQSTTAPTTNEPTHDPSHYPTTIAPSTLNPTFAPITDSSTYICTDYIHTDHSSTYICTDYIHTDHMDTNCLSIYGCTKHNALELSVRYNTNRTNDVHPNKLSLCDIGFGYTLCFQFCGP
eukprot:103143_1